MNDPGAVDATPARAPTIKDVAARAGVGIKTVSRVLNDEPNVRPEMRDRVLEAMASVEYRRNSMASSVRRRDQRTASIGLVVEDLANPFASQLTRVVQDHALRRRYLVLVGSSDGVAEREREIVGEFCSRRVDGLLVVPSGTDQSYLAAERERGTPVVFIDRPGKKITADAVVSENEIGVQQATEHLARHGHTRIGYLGDRQSVHTAERRLAGYRAAMTELDAEPDTGWVRTELTDASAAYRAATGMFQQDDAAPTAVVCGNNLITVGTLHALQALGLRETVAVVGFDDLDLADLLRPALTVITQDIEAIGERSADQLFTRLDNPGEEYARVSVPVRLVPRGSGEIPPPPHGEGE
ncbi:LacI family DNA-binding transcriptional regulator [Haloechinothrix alba]|uniref:LacI family DNA-binding transcriptional regulator n=1 Tax=Haloechinothrix alba TaxID=664784 RepID=UPI001FE736C1|nr:LacI family DNA-binding transcriptional regulator [Haloechinothrix alba]